MRILAAFVFASFCACTGEVQYSAAATTGTVDSPDLVEVGNGVQVVADYDESVFFTDGWYWRNSGDGWYRSHNYAGGWEYADAPPTAVVQIHSPSAFVHYRPSGYVAKHRTYRRPEPIRAREHRAEAREEHREHRN